MSKTKNNQPHSNLERRIISPIENSDLSTKDLEILLDHKVNREKEIASILLQIKTEGKNLSLKNVNLCCDLEAVRFTIEYLNKLLKERKEIDMEMAKR